MLTFPKDRSRTPAPLWAFRELAERMGAHAVGGDFPSIEEAWKHALLCLPTWLHSDAVPDGRIGRQHRKHEFFFFF